MNRRKFIRTSAAAAVAIPAATGAAPAKQRKIGASTSTCSIRNRVKRFESSVAELGYYHGLGAVGAQIGVRSWADGDVAKQVRAKAEELEMF